MRRTLPIKIRKRHAAFLLGAITLLLVLLLALVPRAVISPVTEVEHTAGAEQRPPGGAEAPEPEAREEIEATAVAARPIPEIDVRARLVVILDDAGQNMFDTAQFLDFPGFLYDSVLPHLPYSAESARMARDAGKGVLLHCPMEPLGNQNPGPGVIRTSTPSAEISRILSENLASVGTVAGLNNHMGSRATADPRVMEEVLRYAASKDLLFVDSRTSPASVALSVAAEVGAVAFERDVFLDNQKDPRSIRLALEEGLERAREVGYAILIGHVHSPQLAVVLKEEYARLMAEGYTFTRLDGIHDGAGRLGR